jgi:hypothetical protein
MAKRSISTVLTTNFDDLIARTIKSERVIGYCDEIKTPSDYAMFDTAPNVPQVIYLHGSVDHYSDKNLAKETQRLDDSLVALLCPLLRDHPFVVVGYRGAEPSVMRHLLLEQAAQCMNFRQGIYWCYREGSDPLAQNPLFQDLQSQIQTNLLFIEIESFAGLLAAVNRLVVEKPGATSIPTSPVHLNARPFDMRPSERGMEYLSEALLRSKLVAYAEAFRKETSRAGYT